MAKRMSPKKIAMARPPRKSATAAKPSTRREAREKGCNLEALGKMTLYVDENVAASGDFRTQTGHYALCGEVSASATTVAMPSAASTRGGSRSPAAASSRSSTTSRRMSTSTWSASSPPRWRGISGRVLPICTCPEMIRDMQETLRHSA